MNSIVVAPAELAKVQLQNQAADASAGTQRAFTRRYRNPADFLSETVRRVGPQAAFRGMTATLLRETFAYRWGCGRFCTSGC